MKNENDKMLIDRIDVQNKEKVSVSIARKSVAVLLAGVISAGLLAGCSGTGTSGSADYKNSTVMGEVTKVSSSSITINVRDKNSDEDSKKTATIKIDSDTKISKNSGGPGGKPPSGQPPQAPPDSNNSKNSDSDSQHGQPPSGQRPQGNGGEEIKASDIEKGDNVVIKVDEDGNADSIRVNDGAMGNGPGSSDNSNVTYTAVKTYDEDKEVSGKSLTSTEADENAVLVKDGNVTLSDMDITRKSTASSNGDNASFYGTSAAVLGTGGKTYVSDSTIKTSAEGGAGIFSYGDGTVYASNNKITTSKGSSGGIHVAGGGTLYAWNMNVKTSGQSSAAIRSDRGGGTLVADGGTYTSTGNGSPAVYSTADIAVNNAKLTAKGSEAVCIEGKNSLRLFDSTLTGNMKDDEQNDCTWNVILYQSMSGDSEEGTSEFEMNGGTLTAKNGGMFYTTNTSSKFVLNDVNIKYAEENDFFLKATGNSNARGWGQKGSNGADCDFTAIDQKMQGNVIWDKISKLDFYITDGSSLKGAIKRDNENAGNGKGGYCKVYIDKDSTWTVTGNSKVTELYNAGTIRDSEGNKVTVKDTDGKVLVKGNSKFTITVEKYSTKDKTSSADKSTEWSDYKTEMPSKLA